jgi:hypothetical protein
MEAQQFPENNNMNILGADRRVRPHTTKPLYLSDIICACEVGLLAFDSS